MKAPVKIAAILFAFLSSVSAGKPTSQSEATQEASKNQDQRLNLHARLVTVSVSVSDTFGRYVTGLRKENFDVFDNGVKQEISHFSDEDAPISLGIIYDVSGSMTGLTGQSLVALTRFFDESHVDDEFFLIAFSSKPYLLQDYTVSPNEIINRVTLAKAKGNTALYDAVYLGVEKARQGRHSKKVLLVISDGEENNSRYSGKELRGLLQEADVQIYAIGISWFYGGASTLRQLTGLTGGAAFFPASDEEVRDAYMRIAIALRHQYSLGFYPSDSDRSAVTASRGRQQAQQVWHKLDVKVTPIKGLGRLSLKHRQGYEAFQE
ncbi:MAG TPA: VWA domain-containing protein [Blastocatellia bacterium]|nr:VWA domain-containing protein [Blastocatellia bacterium]